MKILRESPKFPQPQKGQRVKYYNDPFTRTQPLGEAIITKFISENGVCNNIPYWLCEVETKEDLETLKIVPPVRMVIFANMDICDEI